MPPAERATFQATADAIARAVAEDAARLGRLAKWLGGQGVDGSLVASGVAFGLLEPTHPLMTATVRAIRHELVIDRGVHRYREDTYYGGGQWLLLAAMLGWHDALVGDRAQALAQLDWVADHASPEGHLPEQVPDHLLAPAMEDHWLQAWGPVASPLLWSHAMYLTLALEHETDVHSRCLRAVDRVARVPVRPSNRASPTGGVACHPSAKTLAARPLRTRSIWASSLARRA